MAAPLCPVLIRRLRTFSQGVGLGTLLVSALALAAWPVAPEPMRRLLIALHPFAAFTVAATGLSLWLRQSALPSIRRLARALALAPVAYGATGCYFNLFPPHSKLMQGVILPSLPTSLTLILLGLALFSLQDRPHRVSYPSQAFALTSLGPPYLALVGYAFNLMTDGLEHHIWQMSLPMSFLLIILTVGTLCARPDGGVMGLMNSNTLGGSVLRRLAPAAFWAPLILGWLHRVGERAGLFGPELSAALLTLTMSAVGLGLIAWNVTALNRTEAERERIESTLKESEDRYRRLVELSPEAIMVDMGGQLIFVNPAGAALIGAHEASQLIGRSLLEFVHPDDLDAFRDQLARARTERKAILSFEKKMIRLDGSTVDVEATASPITYGGKEAVIAIIRDISERKKTLEEIAMRTAELQKAAELDRLKDHFLSTLSHEMKTPLSLIVGYSELLEEKCPHEELLKGIQDGARRLTEHIENMLDYSALLSGTLPLYKSEVYLDELVDAARHITHASCEAQQHQLITEIDPATPPVSADPRRLTQILVELLVNAHKFTPPGGTVGIRVRPVDGQVALEVWDTGQGIPADELGRIWEPFEQLAIGDTGRRGGLGLGLTIAKKLVELHQGRLTATSEPGKGSRFTVTLPISKG
ncbi:MAG TPA: PAS domain-containing sensor histidine kinase [Stenomitos sp.]